MYIDYHYYMIKALSRRAGFTDEDAQIIAYASEYVDDALEYWPMDIKNLPSLDFGKLKRPDGAFDVVCTAHDGHMMAGGALPDGQRKTYIPYHFIPRFPKETAPTDHYDYRAAPDCPIARGVLDTALRELSGARGEMRTRKLIKLGIALHTYADTWAHQNFSGLYSAEDNAVANLEVYTDGRWMPVNLDFMPAIVPETGHAKAHFYPDSSHSKWRYYNGVTRERIERDNPSIFLQASERIYACLCDAAGKPRNWETHKNDVFTCISYDPRLPLSDPDCVKKKVQKYKEVFGKGPDPVDFNYDEYEWKSAALTPYTRNPDARKTFRDPDFDLRKAGAHIDNISREVSDRLRDASREIGLSGFAERIGLVYREKPDPPNVWFSFNQNTPHDLYWFYFHLEAQAQRDYILERIKPIENFGGFGDQLLSTAVMVGEQVVNFLGIGASKDLKGKDHWITVRVENKTPFPINWTGHYERDFDLDNAHGRYWDRPGNISPFAARVFSACERDNAQTGCGAIVPFSLQLDATRKFNFNVAFSNPKYSSVADGGTRTAGELVRGFGNIVSVLSKSAGDDLQRAGAKIQESTHRCKCRATFDDDRARVWRDLNDRYESGSTETVQVDSTLAIELASEPSQEAVVKISVQRKA